jgi:hypothetical protein
MVSCVGALRLTLVERSTKCPQLIANVQQSQVQKNRESFPGLERGVAQLPRGRPKVCSLAFSASTSVRFTRNSRGLTTKRSMSPDRMSRRTVWAEQRISFAASATVIHSVVIVLMSAILFTRPTKYNGEINQQASGHPPTCQMRERGFEPPRPIKVTRPSNSRRPPGGARDSRIGGVNFLTE